MASTEQRPVLSSTQADYVQQSLRLYPLRTARLGIRWLVGDRSAQTRREIRVYKHRWPGVLFAAHIKNSTHNMNAISSHSRIATWDRALINCTLRLAHTQKIPSTVCQAAWRGIKIRKGDEKGGADGVFACRTMCVCVYGCVC